jgi:DNA-binding GntR family transcriptional regulator
MRSSASGRAEPPVPVTSIFAPTPATLLAEGVVDQIRESILQGHFPPGARLREEQLAEALDVSRGPIRSALLQLEREGLVIRRRNRGAVVASLSRDDLEEVYSLRLATEPVACRWAARHAVEADFAAMQKVIDSYAKVLTRKVTDADAADADLRFHDLVYDAARHRRLQRVWQDIRPQVYVFLLSRPYVRSREFRQIMVDGHGAILSVLAQGDEDQAAHLAEEHVRTSYLRVISDFEDAEDANGADGTEPGVVVSQSAPAP